MIRLNLFIQSNLIFRRCAFFSFHSVFLIVESIVFGLFVFAIMCEQVTSINDQKVHQKSFYYSFIQVFRSNNPILWFLPCEFDNFTGLRQRDQSDKSKLETVNFHTV